MSADTLPPLPERFGTQRTIGSVTGHRFRRGLFGKMVLQVSDHIGVGREGVVIVPQVASAIRWRDADETEAALFLAGSLCQ